jgi:hypothetical protein
MHEDSNKYSNMRMRIKKHVKHQQLLLLLLGKIGKPEFCGIYFGTPPPPPPPTTKKARARY